jgi:glycerol-3-phosphate cytidylyltransferase-like family protein
VIALGYDQEEMELLVKEYVTAHNLKVKVVQIGKFEEDELNSSSQIRQRILRSAR